MSRKLFGKALLVLVASALVAGCVKKIPGDPDKTLEKYIIAIQESDYQTIFALNHLTARRQKYLEQSKAEVVEKTLEQNFERNKQAFLDVGATMHPGVTWSERHFFPKDARFLIGDPYSPVAVGDDPVNAEYERSVNAFVPVDVTYTKQATAPGHDGKRIKTARFDCSLKKIREGKNVTIYSHDDTWYVGGCMANLDSLTYF